MTQCAYHPDQEASTECQRCKRPICEGDKRSYLSMECDRKRHLEQNLVLTLCPLCVTMEEQEEGSHGIMFGSVIGIIYLIILAISIAKGRVVVFGSVLVLVIIGVIVALLFLIMLFGHKRQRKSARADMMKFLKGLKWKAPGNANVTINELLEMPPDKLRQRAKEIYHELTTYFPVSDMGLKWEAAMKKTLESNSWTFNDLSLMFSYYKKNIEYWSWRTDLTEASKNRVAYAFAYLTAVEHVGREEADRIARSAPPGYAQADILPQIFKDYPKV